ncbi:hypothetical protein [Natronospora cellulosivora (SeqCode)]
MGNYLCVGICKNIVISRVEVEEKDIKLNDILVKLNEIIDLAMYDKVENGEEIIWKLKEEFINQEELIKFLELQFEFYKQYPADEENFMQVIDFLKKTNSCNEIIDKARTKSLASFQITNHKNSYQISSFKRLNFNFEIILFLSQGKILMECYSNILQYFERIIRLQRDKFPIAGAVKVFIH